MTMNQCSFFENIYLVFRHYLLKILYFLLELHWQLVKKQLTNICGYIPRIYMLLHESKSIISQYHIFWLLKLFKLWILKVWIFQICSFSHFICPYSSFAFHIHLELISEILHKQKESADLGFGRYWISM